MDMKLTLGFLVFLTLSRTVLCGICTEEVNCKKTRVFTSWILKLLGFSKWEYPYEYQDKCNVTKCCAGYQGEDCSQLTDDCIQNGKCLGHKNEEEYTDGCLCKKEETMNQEFMGSNKRLVYVPCSEPCTRTACSAGFTGSECNERYDQDSTFLTQTAISRIEEQLKIDEGYRDEIYEDSEGYLTFGIGHLITKSDPEYGQSVGTKISETRIQDAFEADVHIAKQGILKIFPLAGGFPEEVKEILVNMAFNLGESRLKKFRKFIAAVNKADWSTAADEMVDSKWYNQVGDRAKRLVDRMRGVGAPQGTDRDDSDCESLSGTCQEDTMSCTGGYQSGLCSGHASLRCCLPAGDDSGCHSLSGACQEDTISCTGVYQSGLCSGHASRRCCLPAGSTCSDVTIISRSQWGARSPTSTTNINVPVEMFFIHHTAGNTCHDVDECSDVVQGIQNDHMDTNGWSDIGYSFLVGEDGNIYEGRGWTRVGAHTSGYNSRSFAASFMGNYMTEIPGSNALQAAKNLISCGIQLGKIAPDYELFGHRDAGSTECPGDVLYAEIQTWPHYSHSDP